MISTPRQPPQHLPALLTTAFMALVAALSLSPDRDSPEGYNFVWLVHVTPTLTQKLMHVVCYALLAAAWCWTLRSIEASWRRPAAAFAIAVAFGAALEVLQAFVPGRFGSPYDIGLNALGAFIGVGTFYFANRAPTR
jgi:VanZ family protein